MTEWFKSWFESEDYLNLYKHRDDNDARQFLNLILNNINQKIPKTLLDIACGAGRHSLLFAEKGFDVTSFDLSKNLLKIAKQKCIEAGYDVNVFCADVRRFALKRKFHLIINLFTSFGYFDTDGDNFLLFKDAFDYLQVNGTFVFDYFNISYLQENLVTETVTKLYGKTFVQKRHFEGNRVIKHIHIVNGMDEKCYYESVQLYSKSEIESVLTLTGFRICNVFGDYSGKSFNEANSPRLIIFAQK